MKKNSYIKGVSVGFVFSLRRLIPLKKIWLGIFLIGFTSSNQAASRYPLNECEAGQFLCESLDLDYPGLELVKNASQRKDYAVALNEWRNFKVLQIRKNYLGAFGWHADQLNSKTRFPYADYMVGYLSQNEFLNSSAALRIDFCNLDISGAPNGRSSINWLVKNQNGIYPEALYDNFYTLISLAGRYYKTTDEIYLKKWFQVLSDFCCNQKNQIEQLSSEEQKKIPCNWSTYAYPTLSQSDRVANIIRGIGVLCKSLPNGGKNSDWNRIYTPNLSPIAPIEINRIPSLELAHVAFSLVLDHPEALILRFQKAGAVPNQRRAGLSALLMITTQFPEFILSKEIESKAIAAVEDYLNGMFYRDGGMLEQSFNYNTGDATAFEDMVTLISDKYPLLAEKIRFKLTLFYRQLASIGTPLGYLPAMSSQSPSNPPPVWQEEATRNRLLDKNANALLGQYDEQVYRIASQLKSDPNVFPPDFTSQTFPYSGYSALRKNWQWNSPYLFFQTSRPARGHYNMGHNSVQIEAFGRPLLVTAGPPVYNTGQLPSDLVPDFDEINQLLGEDSSLKTNTVMVDGKSQVRGEVSQEVYPDPIPSGWFTSERYDFVEGLYDRGYGESAVKVKHRRQLFFVRKMNLWIVADIMIVADGTTHQFSQVWNFPGYKVESPSFYGFAADELEIDAARYSIHTSTPSSPNVHISHFGCDKPTYRNYYGERHPYRGWFSDSFGRLIPAHQLFVDWQSSATSVLLTVIMPTVDEAKPSIVRVDDVSNKATGEAAFVLSFQDQNVVECRVAPAITLLGNGDLKVEAQALLTVTDPSDDVSGLIVKQNDLQTVVEDFRGVPQSVVSTSDESHVVCYSDQTGRLLIRSNHLFSQASLISLSGEKVAFCGEGYSGEFGNMKRGTYILRYISNRRILYRKVFIR